MEESIHKLRRELGIDSSDYLQIELLELTFENAEFAILDHTRRDYITDEMLPVVRALTVIYWNRRGTEGEVSRSEGGINIVYHDIPKSIADRLVRFRTGRLRML